MAQIKLFPKKSGQKKRLPDNSTADDAANTASHLHKRDTTQVDHNVSIKLENLDEDEAYRERVEFDHPVRTSQIHLRSSPRLQTDYCYESVSKIGRYDGDHEKQKRSQNLSLGSSLSRASYRSTTNEEIMSKYDIKQIMKRKHQKQQNKWKNCKLAGKILLIVLLFPFSLIYLLIDHINKKRQQNEKKKPKQQQKQQKRKKPQRTIRRRRQPSKLTKCCNNFQNCCNDYFCYYLCCECCQDCNCCTKCCRKVQKCYQNICQNSLMEGIENFFSWCFVKNCQRFCRFICCHKRTHEKLDTIERLQKMSQKSQDIISIQ